MTYDEIQKDQRVRISRVRKKFQTNGTVVSKEIIKIAGRDVERVYVDTDDRGRRLCAPSVLEPLS